MGGAGGQLTLSFPVDSAYFLSRGMMKRMQANKKTWLAANPSLSSLANPHFWYRGIEKLTVAGGVIHLERNYPVGFLYPGYKFRHGGFNRALYQRVAPV